MQREEITQYSQALDREMNMMVYGHGGIPLLCFPTQDSMCRNYEDFGMTDHLAGFIDSGRIQLFVVDTVDRESWSCREGIPEWRAARQEQYFHYITDEAVPLIRGRNPETPAVTGFSMGANHAVITFLRRPDLFRGVIALSGVYDADYFFDGWMNPVLYENAPERFLGSSVCFPVQRAENDPLRRTGRLGRGRRTLPEVPGKRIPGQGHPCMVRFLGI